MFSNYSTHHNGLNDSDCVVDGDTFWSRGQKIQIAGTDTPELSPLRCEAERVKGGGGECPASGPSERRELLAFDGPAR
jgi:endonuclease YncB( thermonuclease family)